MEHFIRVYDNHLSPEICEEAIERFEAAKDKFPGLILRADGNLAVEPSKKRTMEFIIENDPSWQRVENHLQQHYVACVNEYAQEFPHLGGVVGNLFSEPFRIKKYQPGDFFDWHIDCGGKNFSRVIAIQFYFNTVQDGGETEFQFQDLNVESVQGRVVIFPTIWTYYHRGSPVRSNPKYI
ncbi:MAG: hypothetical protein CMO26_05935 [Thiotrichales bacterium]|nr:hypothetical protein [Thiotrichales bacterium]